MVWSQILGLTLVALAGSIQAYPLVLQYVPFDQVDNEIEVETDSGPAPWFGRTLIQPEGLYGDDAVAPTEDETIKYMPIKRGKKPQKLQTGYYNYDFTKVDLNIDTGVGYLHDDAFQGDHDEVNIEDAQFDGEGQGRNDFEWLWTPNQELERDNSRSLVPFVSMPEPLILARYDPDDSHRFVDTDADFELDDEHEEQDDEYKDQDDEYNDHDGGDDDYHHHNPYEVGHHDLWSHKSKVGSHLHGTWPYHQGAHPLKVFESTHGYSHPLDKYHTNAMYSQGMQTLYHSLKNKYNNKYLGHGHHGGYHYKTIHL